MKMVLRWFGPGHDSASLEQIRQIPGVTGIAGTLMDKQPGEIWPEDEIAALKKQTQDAGLELQVIESVNIHDDIKLGLPTRNGYIEAYRQTIRRLGEAGVRVICYNFMPVFDWMRTDLRKPLPDGSNTMAYEHRILAGMDDPHAIIEAFRQGSGGYSLPGWEPERLAHIEKLFELYDGITTDRLFENLGYFLDAIMPVCEQYDVRMAIHPDDPPWNIFGLPRVIANGESLKRLCALNKSPYNGITLCTGSLGVDANNDLPALIRTFGDRIHFAHVRNFKRTAEKDFYECSHFSADGSLDMVEIMRALYEAAPNAYIRPDHGRMIWGEEARPGYGLYDRALGAMYLQGIWETMAKNLRR